MKRLTLIAPFLALVLACALLLTACSGPERDSLAPLPARAEGLPADATQPTATAPVALAATATERSAATSSPEPVAIVTPAQAPVQTATPATTPSPTAPPTPAAPAVTPAVTPNTMATVKFAGQTQAVPILMYHYVRPDPGAKDPAGEDLSVTPEDFAAEMQYLDASGYTTMTLGELDDVRHQRLALPAKPVVLTFDDGYRDFYTSAWPVLQQHHFKATIFIITGVVDTERYMTWDMLNELDGSGQIEVGAHTVNHPDLPGLSDAQSRAEIFNCKTTLEGKLGHPVRSFAYPAGHYNQRDLNFVSQAGYTIAVTTQGAFSRAGSRSLEMPRVRIHGPKGLSGLKANL